MAQSKFVLYLLLCLMIQVAAMAQETRIIPAYTGYAIPPEVNDSLDESPLFNEKEGLHHWSDSNQNISYYFYARQSGELKISIRAKNQAAGTRLGLHIADTNFVIQIPKARKFRNIKVGSVNILRPGFYAINLSCITKTGDNIADLQSIVLAGTAAKTLQFNAKQRRNAASVHLLYPTNDSGKVVAFYNEIAVPEGGDLVNTYYMACGFARGYFGIQVNSATERRVIFSIWDPVDRQKSPQAPSAENKVQLIAKGEAVIADTFANEGTGGHSHWIYQWQTGKNYKFLVMALPDSATHSTIYSGYFFIPDIQKWKFIASFKAPQDGQYLHGLYSFVEDFDGVNGQMQRKAYFVNPWIRLENGIYQELTESTFSYDATAKAGDRLDYGGGTEKGMFYLWNGGFQPTGARFGDKFTRPPTIRKPVIDLSKNADAEIQSEKDNQIILEAIRQGKYDTTGSKDGIYYKILKEGKGHNVSVTDTVVANYKGYFLNGEVFDKSTAEPASLPLNRLIKGWQIGLSLCKPGGKIMLIIPSGLAYSIRARSEKIPPNSILVFEIEVVAIKKQHPNS